MKTSKDPPRAQVAARTDRRKRPTNPFSISSIFGSRRRIRREADRQTHYYVDRYGLGSVGFFLLALLFSAADALITLALVAAGGTEVNPMMHFLLQLGPVPFLAAKYALTGFSLLFLLIHKEYQWFGGRLRVKTVMAAVVVIYLLLLFWEIFLLVRLSTHES